MSYTVSKMPSKGATDYVVHWLGNLVDPKVTVRQYHSGTCSIIPHGHCRSVVNPGEIWMYEDEARGLAKAIQTMLDDQRARQEIPPTQDELNDFISSDLRKTLTLNRDAAREFIKLAKWRKREGGGVEVEYGGKWLHLCRTDLHDDIRTWTQWSSHGDPDDLSFYAKSVRYGARVTGEAFYIVDSLSDG